MGWGRRASRTTLSSTHWSAKEKEKSSGVQPTLTPISFSLYILVLGQQLLLFFFSFQLFILGQGGRGGVSGTSRSRKRREGLPFLQEVTAKGDRSSC